MKIETKEFKSGEYIPKKFTCNGENINPEFILADIPKETKSLVLIMDDPDVPKSLREDRVFDHWAIFNIPKDTTKISENYNSDDSKVAVNTKGLNAYQGPCPPDTIHRYFFKLYALDIILDLGNGSTKKDIEGAMKNNIIDDALLVGLYEQEEKNKSINYQLNF